MLSLLLVFGPTSWTPWVLGSVALAAVVALVLLGRLPAPGAGPDSPSPAS
jgi:hypothetical protein